MSKKWTKGVSTLADLIILCHLGQIVLLISSNRIHLYLKNANFSSNSSIFDQDRPRKKINFWINFSMIHLIRFEKSIFPKVRYQKKASS